MKIKVDCSYIIAFSLLNLRQVSFFELYILKNELEKRNDNYIINMDYEDIEKTILEWKDFFFINENGMIEMKKNSKELIKIIFIDVLEYDLKNDLIISTSKIKKYKKGKYV